MSSNPTPLIEVTDLGKRFDLGSGLFNRRGTLGVVNSVSFNIYPGEVLGLAGESGSGKTTIGRMILRLLDATSGSIKFDGAEVTTLGSRALKAFRAQAQIIFQDPYGSLDPNRTIGQAIEEPLQALGLITDRRKRRAKVIELLDQVALSERYIDRYPSALSGGQRQRVGIARAIAAQPRFIVADEPVSALDVSIQAQIINLLAELRQSLSLSMLFISHDLAVLNHLADRIAVLYLGRIVEIGPAHQICANPGHPYTIALLSAVPNPDPDQASTRIVLEGDLPSAAAPPSGCVFRTRCWKATAICSEAVPPVVHLADRHWTTCHHVLNKPLSEGEGNA